MGMFPGNQKSKDYLAGRLKFQVKEIEVFKILQK